MLKNRLFYATTVLLLLLALAPASVSAATVNSGSLRSISFPTSFLGAKSVPGYGNYILEGESELMLYFMSHSGVGQVSVTASSSAFASDASATEDITETGQYYTFTLSISIKSGLDGTYLVVFQAKNEHGTTLTTQSVDIQVWSKEHEAAAQNLYVASTLYTSSLMGGFLTVGYQPIVQSEEARATLLKASNEIVLAQMEYNAKNWTNAKTHSLSAVNYLNQAGSAEKAVADREAVGQYLTWGIYLLIILLLSMGAYASLEYVRYLRKRLKQPGSTGPETGPGQPQPRGG